MIKLILLLAIVITMASCKKETNEEIIETYPAELRQEVRDFIADAKTYGNKDIKLKKLKFYILPKPSQLCPSCDGFYSHEFDAIFIDTTKYAFKYQKKVLMYHEMGHGILKRDHRNDVTITTNGTIETSIMHESLPSSFNNHQGYYLWELFNNP